MLNSLMHVSINGPTSELTSDTEGHLLTTQLIQQSVDNWLKQSKRKKLKRKYEHVRAEKHEKEQCEVQTESVEVANAEPEGAELASEGPEISVASDEPENENVELARAEAEQQQQQQQQQLQQLASAVGLEESDCDSAFESDFDE